jgi:streptogramin lyase
MMNAPRLVFFFIISLPISVSIGCGGSISSTGGSGGGSGGACTPSSLKSTPVSCPVLTPVSGPAFSGKTLAGSQQLSGASVQLYAAGNTGNGSAATALLAAPLSTNASGSFSVPTGYTCPSAQTPLYLLSKGGQFGSGPTNPSIWMMTALGPCGSIGASSTFILNEATTAASVWALASFMSTGGNVGATCTNTIGLDNAFTTASDLVNSLTGSSPGAGLPATLAVSTKKLNTLANALASCTASSSGSGCSALFTAAASGSTTPANTLDAALNIAHAPGSNVTAIYTVASGNSTFSPALSVAPPDWTLHSTISGGGMASPASVSVSASGNVWVSSYFNTVSEFQPNGATAFPSGISGYGINQSYGMALDPAGNVWIANEQTNPNSGNGNLDVLNSSGNAIATGITSGGINFPIAITADTNGDVWVVDYGDSKVSLFSSSASALSPSTGWGGTSLSFPVALAVDADHNAWVANQAGTLPVTKISSDGAQVTNIDCHCNGASGVATDQSGDIWFANYYGNSISEVNTCGTLVLDAATGGGVNHPQGIAVDGAGTVWVANYLGESISEANGASSSSPGKFSSPPVGFGTDAALLQPYSLAIDSSGNIWVANFGNNTLTQFIGLAAPVKTPLAGPPQQP